jgi:hypothetical protein
MNTKKMIMLGLLYVAGIMGMHNICDASDVLVGGEDLLEKNDGAARRQPERIIPVGSVLFESDVLAGSGSFESDLAQTVSQLIIERLNDDAARMQPRRVVPAGLKSFESDLAQAVSWLINQNME